MQNTVGADDYGVYFALFNFTFLFQIINDFGIQNFNNRNIARHNQLLGKYFPSIITLKLLLAFGYFLVVFLIALISGYEGRYFHLLAWLAANQILISMIFYLRSNISGLAMYRVDSLTSVLDKLILIVICAFLLYNSTLSGNFKIEWFIYAQTIAFLLTALTAFFIVYKKLSSFRLKFDLKFLRIILKESYPYALIGFLMTIYTRIDGVMLERMLTDGKTQAGIYASAYRLLDASNMLGFLFAGLLLPMFSRMIKDQAPVKELLRFSFQLIWVASVGLVIASFFYRHQIMELLYTEATPYWGEVFGYLIINFVAMSAIYIYGALLTANENIKEMNVIFLIGVIFNILLNYFFIPFGKCLGAVSATLITQYFVMLALMILTQRALKFEWDTGYVIKLLGFAGVLFGSAWAWQNYINTEWLLGFLMVLIFAVLLAFLFKLIDVKKIIEFIGQ